MLEFLWTSFVEPLSQQSFQKALIGGSLVATVCAVVGCYIILRRMAFLGDALSHAMLAGVVAGYLLMHLIFDVEAHALAMFVGSIIAGVITVLLIGFVSQVTRIKEDTAIGIMYTGIFALGGILASYFSDRIHLDLYHFVTGMVLGVNDSKLWLMAIVAALVLSVVILFFRQLQITSFDPIMAASIGIPVVLFDYLLTVCTSLVVVSAVQLVGVILVVGLLVTPAATAYLICDRLHRMQILAAVFGVTGVTGGLYVSTWIGNIATGPSIVLVITLQFVVVLLVAPRYGLIADWLRRTRLVPQRVIEDVMRSLLKADPAPLSIEKINEYVEATSDQIHKSLRKLTLQDLISNGGGQLALTDKGRQESRKILRAHRLWETYLSHVGTPEEQLHGRAHNLEHLHDEETVDYLDDKLGHPLVDPHGAAIPEDFVHLVPGTVVKSAILREGRSGTIESVPDELERKLQVGSRVTAGPRRDNGRTWTFVLESGEEITLDHHGADAVEVRLDEE
jgi:ABC-type Mn2+/Zn2+ transport system permease subunit/Mn-dependent DtxR family transcriptional regulator